MRRPTGIVDGITLFSTCTTARTQSTHRTTCASIQVIDETRTTDYTSGSAMMATASLSSAHVRPGFDISLPLFHPDHALFDAPEEEPAPPSTSHRAVLLSFKGKRYVYGIGSDTRNQLHHIGNARFVRSREHARPSGAETW